MYCQPSDRLVVPAIVTKVHSDTLVDLTAFPPASVGDTVTRHVASAALGDAETERSWFWPERVT